MNLTHTKKGISTIVFTLLATGCGGGGESTATNNPSTQGSQAATIQNQSLKATTDAMIKKVQQSFFINDFNTVSGKTDASHGYHLADVIFTLGTDDLTTPEANELNANAAYDYFKSNVADAGKLSAEESEAFNLMTISEFNEALVVGYYQATAPKVTGLSKYTMNVPTMNIPTKTVNAKLRLPSILNPMTYLNFVTDSSQSIIDAGLTKTFEVMLRSGTMTKYMLELAIKFPVLTKVMIHVMDTSWELTEQMIPYLEQDTRFGELFMQLAYEQPDMAHFVFQKIDAPLYYAMSVAMTRSQITTEYLAEMMNWYAELYFVDPATAEPKYSNFVRLLLDTGAVVSEDGTLNHGDGNELANEKLFYSLFKSPFATGQFIAAMNKIEPEMLTALMDHIFLGQRPNFDDNVQGVYNIYAIAQGMLAGIARDGLSAYTQRFIDFALLIPNDRYLSYGKAFAMAGYSYYTKALPMEAPANSEDTETVVTQPEATVDTFTDFIAPSITDSMESVQSYIEELPIVDQIIGDVIPDAEAVIDIVKDLLINEEPIELEVPALPDLSSLVDIIKNFPAQWISDHTNGLFKGAELRSVDNSKMIDLQWVEIPSIDVFSAESTFNFIFPKGSITMYLISSYTLGEWEYNGLVIEETDKVVTVNGEEFRGVDGVTSYKVYKITIPVNTDKLGKLQVLMQYVDGIAFDISGAL